MSDNIECPRCGTTINCQGGAVPTNCPTCNLEMEADKIASQLELDVDYRIGSTPYESKAEILEATNDRLMLSIPPGGKRANSLGCFGVIWLLITGAVSGGFGFAKLNGEGDDLPIFFFGLLGFFWLIGLGMLYFAIKLKYTRGYLFLSRDRAVHQSIFFSRKKTVEIPLDSKTHARLVESYQENNTPVYRVEIETDGQKISFGTGLSKELKEWYVETTKSFVAWSYGKQEGGSAATRDMFGNTDLGFVCPACGATLQDESSESCSECGVRWEKNAGKFISAQVRDVITPDELSPDSFLSISKRDSGEWVIRYGLQNLADNSSGGGCLLAFGIFWESFVLFFSYSVASAGDLMGIFMLLFTLPFHLVGVGLTLFSLFALFGGFRLTIGTDRSRAKWCLGPVGYTMRFATSSITEVLIKHGGALSNLKNNSNSSSRTSKSKGVSCILIAAGKRIPVTSDASHRESREAAGLIRYCLHDLGYRLQDE
ncbi:MAG: hypothetical protein P8M30_05895 [Planctomycetaceae bacterium]|jgi:hypothetical protein|nr:hypothetical protein [Planctomycetaceae bacterium]MDG2388836.1 hypothetical protein [Planctomycetaceae bacterium]